MKFLFSCNCPIQISTKWQVTHITGCNYVTVSFIHMFHHKYKAGRVLRQTGVQLRDESFLLAVPLLSIFFLCCCEWSIIVSPPLFFFPKQLFLQQLESERALRDPSNNQKRADIMLRYKCVHKTSGSLVAFLGLSGFVWLFIFNLLNSHLHN